MADQLYRTASPWQRILLPCPRPQRGARRQDTRSPLSAGFKRQSRNKMDPGIMPEVMKPQARQPRLGGDAVPLEGGKRYGQSSLFRRMASMTARAALDSQTVRGPYFESGRKMRDHLTSIDGLTPRVARLPARSCDGRCGRPRRGRGGSEG